MSDNVKKWFETQDKMTDDGVILCYRGAISNQMVIALCDVLRNVLKSEKNTDAKIARNIFAVCVENLQNIYRYSTTRLGVDDDNDSQNIAQNDQLLADTLGIGFLAVCKSGDDYEVISSNPIEASKVSWLNEKLTAIKKMSADEIKDAYKKQMRESEKSDTRGSQLGLLEIARRSSSIDFYIKPVNAEIANIILVSRL